MFFSQYVLHYTYYTTINETYMEHSHEHNNNHASHSPHHGKLSWFKNKAHSLETTLVPLFASAPHLPAPWRKVITDIVPWLSIIFGVLGIIGFLGANLKIVLAPLVSLSYGTKGLALLIMAILGLITSVLAILAFKPLQGMKKLGWDYSFYSFIIATISSLLGLLFLTLSWGSVVGILIGAYLLFEVRDRYN